MPLGATAAPWRKVLHPDSAAESQKIPGLAQTHHVDKVDSKMNGLRHGICRTSHREPRKFIGCPGLFHFRSPFGKTFLFWSWWRCQGHWCLLFLLQVLQVQKAIVAACPTQRQVLYTQEVQWKSSTEQPLKQEIYDTNFTSQDPESVLLPPHTQPYKE